MEQATRKPSAKLRAVIAAARRDPSVFIEYVLGVTQATVHEEIQWHWTDHDSSYIEEHRGIGKSVQAAARAAWDIGDNPDIRIKYVQQNDKEASKSVGAIKSILESRRYRQVFPWVEPDLSNWGTMSFKVQRGGIDRDATLEAAGIFGRAGGRWDLLYLDDICDLRNAVQQPSLREQVKEAYSTTWLPMADESRGSPRVRRIGTCYHVDDITADWRAVHRPRGTLLRHPVVDYQSPWGSVYTREKLIEKREEIGPIAYARSYELQPVSSDQLVFPAEWLDAAMVTEVPQEPGRMIAAFDFAFTDKKQQNDPDWSVCLIGFASYTGHLYVTNCVRMRCSFPEFSRIATERCDQLNVSDSVAEANGPQLGIVQTLAQSARFPIGPLNRVTDKFTRASGVQSFMEQGRFHLLGKTDFTGALRPIPELSPVYDELTTFPAGAHDDTVDASIDLCNLASISRSKADNAITMVRRKRANRLDKVYR